MADARKEGINGLFLSEVKYCFQKEGIHDFKAKLYTVSKYLEKQSLSNFKRYNFI